jgi:MoaA/NifB/PqqE/SkfB family radical SAM enzyme
MTKDEIEGVKRERIREEKPLVYEKMIAIPERDKKGIITCRIDIGFNYACNLSCLHCMANRFEKRGRSLSIEDLKAIADEADRLGWCQFNISGGEPLVLKNFDEVLLALQPEKFHIGISTNGYFLTKQRAKELKALGLDKVMISIDSIDPDLHNANRNDREAFDNAIDAIWASKEAGLDVILQHVVTHQNAKSQHTLKLAKFAEEYGFSVDIIIAKALGEWEGRHEILIDKDDASYLRKLNREFPMVRRDIFPAFGRGGGCGAFKKCFHITQYGDVLICVFIHISIGNIFKDSLKTIANRAMQLKYIRHLSPICLAGEDRDFINKYMTKFYGKPLPIDYKEAFGPEDWINDGKIFAIESEPDRS